MNLSTLYRPFELTVPWPGTARRAQAHAPQSGPVSGLSELQRRLVVLHVAQATPTRPADERASWPGVTIVVSLLFAALAVATGAWQ
jgi:hypothetical protein